MFRHSDKIVLKAWNKDYEDITITPDSDFHICGRVLRRDKSDKPRLML
jgi:SOS-response transcriptional repressor LexA